MVRVNGNRVPGDRRLAAGDTVSIDSSVVPPRSARRAGRRDPAAPPELVARFGAVGRGVPILYEDASVLVIDKPRGLVVQPGNRASRGSLLDLLDAYRESSAGSADRDPPFPYTPVHRLDRDTTGALVVAKTRAAARALSAAFASGRVEKVYLAVVLGIPRPASGEITAPITVEKGKRSRAVIDPDGASAYSKYEVARRLPDGRALLAVRIRTGRTHQIRAHLASIGHPLAGDTVYGNGAAAGKDLLLLHAWKVLFDHPDTGARIEVEAPPPAQLDL
jgi:23S rRNA pseudouridine1911/1915/1917 synthase